MDLLFTLLILLLVTRAFGEASVRLGQPALLGELLAGIALGGLAALLSDDVAVLSDLPDDEVFNAFTDLGVFFLMLLAGVELRATDLAEGSGRSLAVAACGFLLPLGVGAGMAWLLLPDSDLRLAQSLFVGTALAITAIPTTVRVLMDLGKLHSAVGRTIVSAAIIDDVLSLLLLAFLTGLITSGEAPGALDLITLFARVALFVAAAIVVSRLVVPRVGRVVASLKTGEFEFTSLLLAGFAFALLAELLELHFILGAFIAGLLFERRIAGEEIYEEVRKRISAVTIGFLAPIFFASVGMRLDLVALTEATGFVLLLLLVAFLTKLIGAGVPAYFLGLSRRESLAVGVGMSARGAVELIIADVALEAGLFTQPDPPTAIVEHLFSAIVIVAIATTIVTPFALRIAFGSGENRIAGAP